MNRFKSILLPLDELKNDGLFKTTFINNHLINFTPVPNNIATSKMPLECFGRKGDSAIACGTHN
jgi:hypothetical protein